MKKYILKPGRHQFAPGEAAVHTNDNLSDEAAEWYLQRYPHIRGLFVSSLKGEISETPKETVPNAERGESKKRLR